MAYAIHACMHSIHNIASANPTLHTCHVLDGQGVDAMLDQLLCQIHIVIQRVLQVHPCTPAETCKQWSLVHPLMSQSCAVSAAGMYTSAREQRHKSSVIDTWLGYMCSGVLRRAVSPCSCAAISMHRIPW
eukprot:scaffold98040_cov30-Tisochrysis_lutea.AAC.1